MLLVLAVALGGAAGALARYGLDRFIEHHLLTVFPWSTFVINITGCFAAGLAVVLLVDRHDTPDWVRTGIVVGFLGAYTTFSQGHAALGIADAAGSVVVGVAGVIAGIAVGRAL